MKAWKMGGMNNRPLTTGRAAKKYGFGTGQGARKSFLKYIQRIEARVGRELIDRTAFPWRIFPITIAQFAPEMMEYAREMSSSEELRNDISGFIKSFEARIDEVIERHPRVVELRVRVEKLEKTIDIITGRPH